LRQEDNPQEHQQRSAAIVPSCNKVGIGKSSF